MSNLTPADFEQLSRFDEYWRVVLESDDPLKVWELRKRGYLETLQRRTPLFKLSPKGEEALNAMRG